MSTIRAALVGVLFASFASSAECGATVTRSGSKLAVKCDDASTTIVVDGLERLGELAVVVDGNAVGEFGGIRDLDVKGGDGDDTLFVGGIRIGGTLKAKLGDGDDRVSIGTTRSIVGDQRLVFIGQNVDLSFGGDAVDVLDVDVDSNDFGITIGRDLVARDVADIRFDGEGLSNAAEVVDITIGGRLKLRGKLATDATGDSLNVRLSQVNVGGATTLDLGPADDRVNLSECTFGGKFTAKLGAGNDEFEAGSTASTANAFFAATSIHGGSGESDTITLNVNEFAQQPSITQFEVGP